MLYRICAEETDRKIVISFRDKESFCESRMARLVEGLGNYKSERIPKAVGEIKKKYVLNDEAFFDIEEFNCIDDLENAYREHIGCGEKEKENYERMKESLRQDNDLDNKTVKPEEKEPWDAFFKMAYDCCISEIQKEAANLDKTGNKIKLLFDDNGNMLGDVQPDKLKPFLTKCFKVTNKPKASFSSMVERIDVIWPASDELKGMLKANNLKSLTIVDTYGINHEGKDIDDKTLKDRLVALMDEFSDEKQEIKINGFDYALYVNQLSRNKNDFASKLNVYIPSLVAARSSVMCYVVLTGSDIPLLKGELDNYEEALEQNEAYIKLHNSEDSVYTSYQEKEEGIIAKLEDQNVSDKIIESRINAMVDYLTLYCADFKDIEDAESSKEKTDFLKEQNHDQMERLLFAMTQRIHLGSSYISREQLENENWNDILNIEKLLKNEAGSDEDATDPLLCNGYIHHNIIYALARRYSGQRDEGVTIGYSSPAIGPIGYLNPNSDRSILKTPLAHSFSSGLGMEPDEKPGFLDSTEQFSAICEVMNHHLDELLCREKKGVMRPAVCSSCPAKETCLSYQIYLLSGLKEKEAWSDGYHVLRKKWKDKYLNLKEIIDKSTDNQKQKLQACITNWFEECIKVDILGEYNLTRLTILLRAEKEDNKNRGTLKDKFDEYVKIVYGENYSAEDREEALTIVKEKVFPKIKDDEWLNVNKAAVGH